LARPIDSLIAKYKPTTAQEFENALKETIQEITLAGLARAHFFEKAAFYGGTALRIFYGLPRFSEDLDFTLLSEQHDFSLKSYFNSVSETLGSFGLEVEIEEIDKKIKTDVDSAFLKANTKIHFLKIEAGKKFADKIQSNKKISVKFEVDTTPPLGFETEVKVLPPPITSSVKVLKPAYLFAGKMHAILFRNWKTRVKGRDFYDFLWYLGQKTPLNLGYLEAKMRDKDLPVFWRVTKKAIESVSIHLPNEQNNARLRNPVVRTALCPSRDLYIHGDISLVCSSHQVVAFSFESSGLRLTQSIRSNSHAGTRIHIEFLTPDPVLSLLTEQSLAYFTVHAKNLSENLSELF
jgi:predicted nucleotidyltransferase component of viral defense system